MKKLFTLAAFSLSFSTITYANDFTKGPPAGMPQGAQPGMGGDHKGPPQMNKETRAKLAGIHEKFAACLKSERDMMECGEEMKAGCASMPNGRCGQGPGPGGRGGMGGPGGMKKGGDF